jgi:hypothetical protein
MSAPPPAPETLPPPTALACWLTFLAWVLGVPLAVIATLAVIWAALWALGSTEMEPRAAGDMVTTLWWLAVIVLLYPAMLVIWIGDLRRGLRRARDWAALPPEARAAALAAAAAAGAAASLAPKRRKRRKG